MPVPLPRSNLTRVAAVLAVVALVSSAVFVVLNLSGDGPATPSDAVRRLFQSAADGDPAGALEAITPAERALVRLRGYEILGELERLGLVVPFDHAKVPGTRVQTDALAFVDAPLGPSLTAVDVIGGRITLVLDPAYPVSATAHEILARDFGADIAAGTYTRDFAQYPLRIVAVDDGHGWYVSIAYSVAEALRGASPAGHPSTVVVKPRQPTEPGTIPTLPPPQFGKAFAGGGAPTAEGAVRKFAAALVAHEADDAVALVVPDEARIFNDYLPLLQFGAGPGTGSAINTLDVVVAGDGAERTVRITAFEADVIGVVQNLHLSYTGTCYQAAYRFGDSPPYVAFERCNDAAIVVPAAPAPNGEDPQLEAQEAEARRKALLSEGATQIRSGESPPRDNVFNALAVFGGGVDFPTFTVVEQGERWYISPARTIVDSALATLRAMKPEQAGNLTDRLRRSVAPSANDFLLRESRDPDNGLFGPSAAAKQPLVALCFTDVLSTIGEYGIAAYGPQCLRNLVSSGKVERGAVEAMVLFGECLTADHEGPPEATNAMRRLFLADRATRACLQRHVDAGEAPAEALDRMNKPEDQTCFLPYQGLEMTAPEADWAAADAKAFECLDQRMAGTGN